MYIGVTLRTSVIIFNDRRKVNVSCSDWCVRKEGRDFFLNK